MTESKRYIRIGFPLGIMALCAFLWTHITRNGAALDAVPSAVGPGGWPRAMLIGLALFAVLALASELLEWRRSIRRGDAPPAAGSEKSNGSELVALAGIGIILAYGFLIPYLGFAFATVAFVAVWCVMGRIRSWVTIAAVSVLGTLLLLYMFVALAKMPLNRGVEPINGWTIALYRLLRIY
ncbi:MAG: tripartite tricarboxylate transporter TctB family protein [Hyphomicrobiaceae bacterium]|nr:tripartite tricarboxylate transporter TctB family protein [Hyphomicrobiaceae bacterium]